MTTHPLDAVLEFRYVDTIHHLTQTMATLGF
jgi:hypothetical protein